MAREVRIVTWCDLCIAEGRSTPASEYVGLNSAGARVTVDMCEDHALSTIKPAIQAFDAHGRFVEKQTRSRRQPKAPGPCPECGAQFDYPQALGMHRWRKHGVESAQRKRMEAQRQQEAEQPGVVV